MFTPGKPLHNETQRHVHTLSTRDNDHIRDLDVLIRGLHSEGLWDKLSLICVVGPDETDSLRDLKGSQDSVKIGAPAFVANRGFTTVSTTAVINTQFTLDASFSNDVSLSAYIRSNQIGTDKTLMGEVFGSFAGYVSLQDYNTTELVAKLQDNAVGTRLTIAGGGFRAGSRSDAGSKVYCGDEVARTNILASVSWAGTHYPVHVGCYSYSGGRAGAAPNQYAHWSVGHGLSAFELLAYDNLIKDYMTSRGAAV